jgi:hypothetical protein
MWPKIQFSHNYHITDGIQSSSSDTFRNRRVCRLASLIKGVRSAMDILAQSPAIVLDRSLTDISGFDSFSVLWDRFTKTEYAETFGQFDTFRSLDGRRRDSTRRA